MATIAERREPGELRPARSTYLCCGCERVHQTVDIREMRGGGQENRTCCTGRWCFADRSGGAVMRATGLQAGRMGATARARGLRWEKPSLGRKGHGGEARAGR